MTTTSNIYVSVDEEIIIDQQLTESPLVPQNVTATINDDDLALISWNPPLIMSQSKQNSDRELVGYNVYSGFCSENDEVAEWILVVGNTTDNNCIDQDWNNYEPGIYKYAVEAVYSNDTSPQVYSNDLINNMTAHIMMNIVTNSGDSSEGAIIHLINLDNHPLHNYTITTDQNGFAETEIWKGIYNITVSLTAFETYTLSDEEILADAEFNIALTELLIPSPAFSVINYILSWETEESVRSFLGYNISIDGSLILQEFLGNSVDLNQFGTGSHTVQISAVYTTGESQITELDYIDGFDEFKEFSHPIKVPCPFLKDNRCTIHDIRPKSCREYPLLTGDLGVDYPALKSFKKFLKAFNPDKVEYKVDEDSIEPVKIPTEFLELFVSLKPSKEELSAFLKLNKLEKNLNLEIR